jgi:hypothetical protein
MYVCFLHIQAVSEYTVCAFIYMFVYKFFCMYVKVILFKDIRVISRQRYMHVYVCTCMYVCMHVCMYACMYAMVCVCMSIMSWG